MFDQGFDYSAVGEAAAYYHNSNDDSDNSFCRHIKFLRMIIIVHFLIACIVIVRNHNYDFTQNRGNFNSESS